MKKYLIAIACCMALAWLPGSQVLAQEESKKKELEKKEADKVKEKKKIREYDEVIIRKKTDKDSKVTVEIKDGELFVNGKPVDEFEDENISVHRNDAMHYSITLPRNQFRSLEPGGVWRGGDAFGLAGGNSAFLGVTSEEADGGAKIVSVSENSAAAKAGLKKGDVITRIDEHDIDDPEDLVRAIGKYDPEDKITVTYKRDGKENKASVTLGKNKNQGEVYSYNFRAPRVQATPKMDFNWEHNGLGQTYTYSAKPRLGIRAQDTESGKGVKVIDVYDESLAEKSGIKEGDIITEFDGKVVNSADALADAAKGSKEKASVNVKILRAGKAQTIVIKTPKKLKTTNL